MKNLLKVLLQAFGVISVVTGITTGFALLVSPIILTFYFGNSLQMFWFLISWLPAGLVGFLLTFVAVVLFTLAEEL